MLMNFLVPAVIVQRPFGSSTAWNITRVFSMGSNLVIVFMVHKKPAL